MCLYLDRNLLRFGRKESSFGYRLTAYVDGIDEAVFDRLKDWQNALQSHLEAHQDYLREESVKLVQDIHNDTKREWDGYHCFIGIHNMHAQLLFIPIESKDTPYNETGWYSFSCSFPIDTARIHLAFSEESTEEYAVYFQGVNRQYEDYRLFLVCNVLTSWKALQSLAYIAALSLGNYRQLESDCLEYAKTAARLAVKLFATEHEIQKAAVNLRMCKLDLQALDYLTVTSLKSEATSRRKQVSRYPALSSIISMRSMVLLNIVLAVMVSFIVNVAYHFLFH